MDPIQKAKIEHVCKFNTCEECKYNDSDDCPVDQAIIEVLTPTEDKMKEELTDAEKQQLIELIKPHLATYSNGHCFGSTSITDENGNMTTRLHNGKTFEQQEKAWKAQTEAAQEMNKIVFEFTKKDVYINPSTYSDIYFCEKETNIVILGIDSKGNEIKGYREYV